MINGNLEQFLDLGWCTEATLFFEGYIYWCEGYKDPEDNTVHFFVDKWKAENEKNLFYHTIIKEGQPFEWERIFERSGKDFEIIKKDFLEANIFDGKSFWEIETKLAWLDDGGDIIFNS